MNSSHWGEVENIRPLFFHMAVEDICHLWGYLPQESSLPCPVEGKWRIGCPYRVQWNQERGLANGCCWFCISAKLVVHLLTRKVHEASPLLHKECDLLSYDWYQSIWDRKQAFKTNSYENIRTLQIAAMCSILSRVNRNEAVLWPVLSKAWLNVNTNAFVNK